MSKTKSQRNKTINTGIDEGYKYLSRCIHIDSAVFTLEEILDKTIHGDTFRILPLIPKNSIDLIIVDPPYNLTKSYNGNVFSQKNAQQYEKYTRHWLDMVAPLLKSTGSIYVCCDWKSSIIISNILSEYFIIQNRITWQREKGRGAKSNWKNGMEDIWFATKGNDYTFNLDSVKIKKRVLAPYKENGAPKDWVKENCGSFRQTCPSNFWDDITIPFWSMPENTEHPTQKPEKLIAKLMLASSNLHDIILDPFLGSGTSSVVAKKLNRHYIGIEKEAQYCLWAEKRLEMAEISKEIQGYVNGVFWERNSAPRL